MTEKYPLLTDESVKYWYWECDPAYSIIDIVKVTGAPFSTVQRFMNKNDIPKRTRSEANLNRFKCTHKREDFVRQRNSPEFKKNQSKNAVSYWLDKSLRRKMVNSLKKYNESVLGELQIKILHVLRNYKGMFLSDLNRIINNDKSCLDGALRTLHNRGLLTREKQVNPNTSNSFTSHYYYSVNDKGINLLAEKEEESKFTSLFDSLKNNTAKNNLDQKENSISTYLGKNQKVILSLFHGGDSLFLTDLKKLTSLDKVILDSSLRGLFTRGILSRKKELNTNSANHLKHFRYRLTELGKKLR